MSRELLLIGGLPALIALVAVTIGLASRRAAPSAPRTGVIGSLLAAFALALGYTSADVAIIPTRDWWPANASYRLLHVALFGLSIALLAAAFRGERMWRMTARGVVRAAGGAAIVWLLIGWMTPRELSAGALSGIAVLSGVAFATALELADRGLQHLRGPAAVTPILLIVLLVPPLLFLGKSASLAQQSAGLVVVLAVWWFAAWIWRDLTLAHGPATVLGALLLGFALNTHTLDGLPILSAVIVPFVIATLGVAAIPAVRRWRPLPTTALVAASAVVALAAAYVPAVMAFQERQAEVTKEDGSAADYGY